MISYASIRFSSGTLFHVVCYSTQHICQTHVGITIDSDKNILRTIVLA